MPYASCLVSCSVVWRCQLACPDVFFLRELCVSKVLGFAVPFYAVHICTALWDIWSGLVHSGIACLVSQASDWLPFLGVHPSISIVKLITIGYCCNCLDGQFNY